MSMLKDANGKWSAKRIWGSIMFSIGIVLALHCYYMAVTSGITDAVTAKAIISMFLMTGGPLIGIGTFENTFKQKDK